MIIVASRVPVNVAVWCEVFYFYGPFVNPFWRIFETPYGEHTYLPISVGLWRKSATAPMTPRYQS